MMPCVGYGGRDDYDRGYGGQGYDRDYDDRDRYLSRRGWDDGACPYCRHVLTRALLFLIIFVPLLTSFSYMTLLVT